MKSLKITLILSTVITVVFVCYLLALAKDYRRGICEVTEGNYEAAFVIFTNLDGYQDSEVLAEYCRVMAEYDSDNYPSVFRSYHLLKDLEIDNEDLAVEIASSRAEIKALYLHCGE